MDHDFLKGGDRERPFTPPPEPTIFRWLGALLILLALLYAGYRVVERQRYRPPVSAINPAGVAPSRITEQATKQTPSSTAQEAGARMVTKCLTNGKTTYSDGDCAAGAKTTQIITKENHNLMEAVRISTTPSTAAPTAQSTVVAQGTPPSDYPAMKAECAAWDERVKYLDALARQPLDGQTQDSIRSERKKVRDTQARIPCR